MKPNHTTTCSEALLRRALDVQLPPGSARTRLRKMYKAMHWDMGCIGSSSDEAILLRRNTGAVVLAAHRKIFSK